MAIKRRCCGIIPLSRISNHWEVFLIQHVNGGHWGFPKGHALQGESSKEAAERELFEETGLRVLKFLQVPPLVERYQFFLENEKIDKTVHLLCAETTRDPLLDSKEVLEGKWMLPAELLSYVTFEEGKALCRSLIDVIKKFYLLFLLYFC